MQKQKGLTLIELLAVIAIIAILFVLLIPQISSGVEKTKVTGIQTDMRSYQIALKSYFISTGNNAKSVDEFNSFLDKPLRFEGNESLEKNPYGNPYIILIDGGDITITSLDNKKVPKMYQIIHAFDENNKEFSKVLGFD